MKYTVGLDEHSNNTVIGIIDDKANKVFKKKLPNDITAIKEALKPFKKSITGAVVESTFNWYWLVDGLGKAGYKMHLANPSAIKQYEGLKHTNDFDDAFHLANLLRLDILPEGHIYPKEKRAIRDLLRKRLQMVRQRTMNILCFQNMYNRTTGHKMRVNEVKTISKNVLVDIFKDPLIVVSAQYTLSVIEHLSTIIKELEKIILQEIKLQPEFIKLQTIVGVGNILALTIALETGDISRFENAGHYSSYCRCVPSICISNDKKKGRNNRKNGNKYLAWAFIEAAIFAIRFCEEVKRFYQRKAAVTNRTIALKSIANKLSKAAYFVMRDKVDFSIERAFGAVINKVATANHCQGVGF